jgi:hypothetical protein
MHNLSNRNLSKMTADEIVQSLQSDSESGLTILEALNRLHSHGPNKFEVEEKVSGFVSCKDLASCLSLHHSYCRNIFVGNIWRSIKIR